MKKLSIVIPIYNEKKNVEKILKNLKRINGVYETIFVDSSKDIEAKKLIDEASKDINVTYIQSEKSRSLQMNYGFKHSVGDVVLFLHCDSIVEENLYSKISESIENGIKFGCLSIYFDDCSFLMRLCGYMSRKRVMIRKIAFGDQGLFFKRSYFEELGGFKEIPIMEDYDISIRSKKHFPVVQINSKIITSSRKFYEGNSIFNKGIFSFVGVLKTMYLMQLYQYRFRHGVSPKSIVKDYYRLSK